MLSTQTTFGSSAASFQRRKRPLRQGRTDAATPRQQASQAASKRHAWHTGRRPADSMRLVSRRRGRAGAARTDERKVWNPSSRPTEIFGERGSPPAVPAERDRRGKGLPAEIRRRIRHRIVPSAGVVETSSPFRRAGGRGFLRPSRKSCKCNMHSPWELFDRNVRACDEGRQALCSIHNCW